MFKLKGNDMLLNLSIEPWESALGNKRELKIIDQVIKIYIPKGTKSGDKIEIPGKGYKDRDDNRGSLIIRMMINLNETLSEKEMHLYEELKKVTKNK